MKKSLVALAALAVVGAASAQSSVTIYGLMDMSLASAKDQSSLGGASKEINKTSIKNGVSNGSRIGFKGTEDLGGGLKANFLVELSVTPDEKATDMVNRQSYVGLSGGFGAVTVGRQYSPYYNTQSALDLVGNVSAPGYVVNNHLRDLRNSNAIQYTSPTISGVTGVFQVAAGDETPATAGQNQAGKNYGLSVVYANGPVVAGFAYDSVATPTTTATAGTTNYSAATGAAANSILKDERLFGVGSDSVNVWAAGGSYDFNVVKAAFAYSSLSDVKAGRTDIKSKGWNLSVAAPFGATTVSANLGRATVAQDGVAGDATINGYQLRANYALSKRTTAYAVYGADKLEVQGTTGDYKRSQVSTGIRHTF